MSDVEVFHDIIDIVIEDNTATVDVMEVSGTPDIDVIDVVAALPGTPGPQGDPGPPGPPGPVQVLAYRHVQMVPALVWTVIHDLDFQPSVIVVNSAKEAVVPGTTEYLTPDTVRLTFSGEVAGEAYLS